MALSERVGAEGHEDEAAIFMAHAAMAWDPTLVDGAASRIREQGEDGVAAILASGAAAAAQLGRARRPAARRARRGRARRVGPDRAASSPASRPTR